MLQKSSKDDVKGYKYTNQIFKGLAPESPMFSKKPITPLLSNREQAPSSIGPFVNYQSKETDFPLLITSPDAKGFDKDSNVHVDETFAADQSNRKLGVTT